jgi:sporulation protein YunB
MRFVSYRRRARRRLLLSFAFFLFSLGLLAQAVHLLDRSLRPPFMAIATGVARQVATQAINDALTRRIAEDAEYARIVEVDRDSSGHVTSAHFNFAEVARIESLTTLRVQHVLARLEERTIYVPALQAMGSAILATLGPSIPIHIQPLGSAQSDVQPVVFSAGVNQTVHILYLHITAQVAVVVPFVTEPVRVETRIPIAYVVFVGAVPQTVVGAGASVTVPGAAAAKEGTQ